MKWSDFGLRLRLFSRLVFVGVCFLSACGRDKLGECNTWETYSITLDRIEAEGQRSTLNHKDPANVWSEVGTLYVYQEGDQLWDIELRAIPDVEIQFSGCYVNSTIDWLAPTIGVPLVSAVSARASEQCPTDDGRPYPAAGTCPFGLAGEVDENGQLGLVIDLADYGVNNPVATTVGATLTVTYTDNEGSDLAAIWEIEALLD